MLSLSRRPGESITIYGSDGETTIVIVDVGRGRCRLGIDAPQKIKIVRTELPAEKQENEAA